MSRMIDRVIARIAPKATASACNTQFKCQGGYQYARLCCLDSGCGSWEKTSTKC